ncbi:nucleotidyltransferase domain-containing protein [Desulfobulbus sp. US4]|nr:nucleotidyltransferase domain-containing protein [Desulfobulbus sp. US4]
MVTYLVNQVKILHQVREEVHRLLPDAKVILHGSRARNEARQDSDRDFLIIADHQLDREIITKLKDGLYDIALFRVRDFVQNNLSLLFCQAANSVGRMR